jgi:hypothetical protein
LPDQWIEKLFARFEAMYGAKFADAWKGCDLKSMKSLWAETLGALSRDELANGVAGCMSKDWPPTLPEFVKLCRMADPNAPGGHPTANEAWALVLASRDETDTVVWTEQIAEAAGIARPIIDAGDDVGARMASGTPTSGSCARGRRSLGGSRAWAATPAGGRRRLIGRFGPA